MRLSFGQELRQVQKQILSPRMIQSMEILQLPVLALQERIEQEMEENPVLDLVEPESSEPVEEVDPDSPDTRSDSEKEMVVDEAHNNEEDFERLLNMTEDLPDHFDERSRPSADRIEQEAMRKHDTMANMADRPQTLHDYLHDQLSWFDLDPELRALVDRIIYNLNDDGRLQGQLSDLLEPEASPDRKAIAQQALEVVQKLDPPGVGARDDRECLLLQVTPGMAYAKELQTIIRDHLDDLAHNRLPVIAKKTKFSIEKIHEIWNELKKLDPHPGSIFRETQVPAVTPDVFVERDDDGKYVVRLDDERTPSLFISPYYRKLLSTGKATAAEKEYIKRKIGSAQWLIESIEQRRSTLTRVSQAIVDHQTLFLDKGPEAIEPLKMQQIADKVGVHVTTVSRAVDDKWIQTPRGIFPLKRFFVGGTIGADGAEVTWDAIRLKLQEVIDHEDKKHPLSDEALVDELAKHGLKVARRTVTKYRKSMNIPSSRERRDWLEEGT